MSAATFRVYIAATVDGFIARPDGGIDWLQPFEAADYGYDAFIAGIGTVVMGRASYELARSFAEWPYPGRRSVVLTGRPPDPQPPPGVTFSGGDVAALAARLRAEADGDVWVMGGGETIHRFLAAGCIDHMELFVIPLLLGGGIPLFRPGGAAHALRLAGRQAYGNGVVRLSYAVR